MTIGDRIKSRRVELGIMQSDLANRANITKQTLYKYENNLITNIPASKIVQLAKILNVSPTYLMGWERDQDHDKIHITNLEDVLEIFPHKVPLLGEFASEEALDLSANFEDYTSLGSNVRCDFGFRCKDDSMIKARVMPGDLIFVRKQDTVRNGEVALVMLGQEASLRRVYFSENSITFVAQNPVYPPQVIYLNKPSQLSYQIIGKAIAFQSIVQDRKE